MQHYMLLGILAFAIALFASGKWRYDIVALFILFIFSITQLVPFDKTFTGFSHPAVITVACIMIITQSISQSGLIEVSVRKLLPMTNNLIVHISLLVIIAAILSAFMNNVGALALMLPIAIRTAHENKRSPSIILMPLAFGSALGGLMTAIGTPPNLLISTYRKEFVGESFAMFDFLPVGATIALLGTVFIAIIGWRFLPKRISANADDSDHFHIEDYTTEVFIPETSTMIGKTIRELEQLLEGGVDILNIARPNQKPLIARAYETIKAKDILIIQASHKNIQNFLTLCKFELASSKPFSSENLKNEDMSILEAVVSPRSRMIGRSSKAMRLRYYYDMNMLAISREGKAFKQRINDIDLQAGDVVLLQGKADVIRETAVRLGLLPLAERDIHISKPGKMILPVLFFAIAIVLTANNVLPIQVAFVGTILFMTIFNLIPIQKLYDSIEWPIIILLGCMIPVGGALQTTGTSGMLSSFFLSIAGHIPPFLILGLLMVITMTLSDFINNTATVVILAPIAVSIANTLSLNIDPFLMTVAVGASCSFLTPIGHQNNLLVMGPGGYKFFDFLRLGLPLEVLVLIISIPAILYVWPI